MKKNKPAMLKLYLSYHLNKSFFIMLGIVLILWIIILVSNSGYPYNLEDYLNTFPTYHQFYYQESFSYLSIINGVLVSFIVGSEVRTEEKFDPLFVSFVSRRKIITSRLIANIILILFVITCEVICLNGIGLILYPELNFELEYFLLIPYSLIYLVLLMLIGEIFVKIFNSYFVSVVVFFIHMTSQILFRNIDLKDKIINFIPQPSINDKLIPIIEGNLIIYIVMLAVIYMIVLLLYQKKDIKTLN